MPRTDSDRNLLFGILALQMDFITQEALITAMLAWSLAKHRPIGEILVEQNALGLTERDALEAMLVCRLAKHGNDPVKSLAALSSVEAIVASLQQAITDPDLHASIALVNADPHATRVPDTTDFQPLAIRYRKVRDHARGGLGIVYVALDGELKREVALKEIKPEFADNLASQSRFLLEAEITGGLEHPGIVPVYGLGAYDDGRPFYAMRFIKGDSLKHAIASFHTDPTLKKDPGARALALQKLLRRFLDVCNAIAYAHSRGVLHRDLKPDNVMVGKYGETLVVDWGLAKAVGRKGTDVIGPLPESTVLYPVSSGSAETLPGSQIGTPAYMSPEQAAGRLDLLGPASDVYSLGATLYTLLTNKVPFAVDEKLPADERLPDLLKKVERGEFSRPRESTPWLDPALEAITLKAMASRFDTRYPSPKTLADDVERWLADETVTAHREAWTRKTRRWAGKHRTAVTSVVSTILVAAVLIGVYTWAIVDRTRRIDAAGLATLAKVGFLEAEARKSSDPDRWAEAIAEARRAEAQLESGGGSHLVKSRARAKLLEMQDALRALERDRKLVEDLNEARLTAANIKDAKDDPHVDANYDFEAKADAILAAFRSYGIDLETLPIEEAASRIRTSRIAGELIVALDETAPILGIFAKKPLGDRLSAVASLADTEARGADIRQRIARKDYEGLRRLVDQEAGRRELGVRCRTVFNALSLLDPTASVPVLEAIYRENRGDFWLTHGLARACQRSQPPRLESAIRYYHAAAALEPRNPGVLIYLGEVLRHKDEYDASVAVCREAVRFRPDYAGAYLALANALHARDDFEGSIAAGREAIRLKPEYAFGHLVLGATLFSKGDLDGSIAAFREGIRLKPDFAEAHRRLGITLNSRGELDEAIAEIREAIRINPADPLSWFSLSVSLNSKGDLDGSIAASREVIRLKPDLAQAHSNLNYALNAKGELDAAIAAGREAVRLRPDLAMAHVNLAAALGSKKEFEAAIAACREALRLQPGLALAHDVLGATLGNMGDVEGSIASGREAIRLKPDYAEAYFNLGNAYNSKGEVDAGITAYREAVRLKPNFAMAHYNLGVALRSKRENGAAIASFREALRLKPDLADAHNALGATLDDKGEFEAALAAYREAIRIKPDYAEAYANLGLFLHSRGDFDGALAACREAIRLQPGLAMAHVNLGKVLRSKKENDAAIAAYREAIRLKPDLALAHLNLGNALTTKGEVAEAISVFREAIRLNPDFAEAYEALGFGLRSQGDLDQAIAAYRSAVRLKPDDASIHQGLGVTLKKKGDLDGAILEYRTAIRIDSKDPDLHWSLAYALETKRDVDGAIAEYQIAIGLNPKDAAAHWSLANLLRTKGDVEGAIAEYRIAIGLNPKDATAHWSLANLLRTKGDVDGAIASYCESIRLEPNDEITRNSLGYALESRGKLDEAIASYREAIRIKPDNATSQINLGHALRRKGDLDGAILAFRTAIRLKPGDGNLHFGLGLVLAGKGDLDAAIVAYREAIRIKPDDAAALCRLGQALESQGKYVEALSNLQRGHELGSRGTRWTYPSADWVRKCRRLVELDAKLADLLKDDAHQAEPGDRLELAELCNKKALYAAAARFYGQAFADQPQLAENLEAGNRYNAACAAALAGSGSCKDEPPPDDPERAKLREQSLGWLRTDLTAWGKMLDGGDAKVRSVIVQALGHWKEDTDLAGIRDEPSLAKLLEAERKTFRALWADVEALRKKAEGP